MILDSREGSVDIVFINGLEVDTVIGVYDWERGIRQCLTLDLQLGWDIRPSAVGDELALTLDYAAISARIQQFADASDFQLVETFAERLAALLMAEFSIAWLRLRVTKPGAVPAARGGVGVEIERGCR
nr:dihydroneopterin aldolase [Pseudomonas sp. NW5]